MSLLLAVEFTACKRPTSPMPPAASMDSIVGATCEGSDSINIKDTVSQDPSQPIIEDNSHESEIAKAEPPIARQDKSHKKHAIKGGEKNSKRKQSTGTQKAKKSNASKSSNKNSSPKDYSKEPGGHNRSAQRDTLRATPPIKFPGYPK